jgi:hypothetical protein
MMEAESHPKIRPEAAGPQRLISRTSSAPFESQKVDTWIYELSSQRPHRQLFSFLDLLDGCPAGGFMLHIQSILLKKALLRPKKVCVYVDRHSKIPSADTAKS